VILQALPSLIVIAFIWFLPESPRCLFANGKSDEARAVLIKYHGNGNDDCAIVRLECNEIQDAINYMPYVAGSPYYHH
jgi:Sugar (and other) transporter